MSFPQKLSRAIKETSPVCVGLDPRAQNLPDGIEKNAHGILEFCSGILEAVEGVASCIKPQMAFFELFGWEGMKVFLEVCERAKKRGFLVIADGKRGDIGSTAEAYAQAYLRKDSPIDALTVNPYLGSDGVRPFIEVAVKNDKGIFVLVKTSNPSSVELQDLAVGDEAVHEHMAQLTESWATGVLDENGLSCVGAVVGATYPEEMKYLRTLMPHVPFLIPGYGAQGGTAEDARHGFLPDGQGAIVSASRSIIEASVKKDWKEAARKAAELMAADLRRVLAK